MKPLVSIIIPAYNSEKYIAACIESCINQTYDNLEVIVIDDGSSDNTYEYVKKYADCTSKVKLLHIENSGVSNARNMGMEHANGEYITFVDADDELLPNSIQIMTECMLTYDADIVHGGNILVENEQEKKRTTGEEILWNGNDMLEGVIEDNPAIYTVWGKMYKKDFINDIRFKKGQIVHEDSYFLFKCAVNKPKMIIIDECIYKYFSREGSVRTQSFSEKKYHDIMNSAEEKVKEIHKKFPEYYEKSYNIIIKACMSILNNCLNLHNKELKKYEANCIKKIIEYRKNFVSVNNNDKKLFFVVNHHLYYMYKKIHYLLHKVKNK